MKYPYESLGRKKVSTLLPGQRELGRSQSMLVLEFQSFLQLLFDISIKAILSL